MFLWLETLLYDLPKPQHKRTKPLKVLCLGPSRSGTESLRNALLMLDYKGVFHGYEVASRKPPTFQACVLLNRRKFDDTSSPDHELTRADFDAINGDCEALTDMPMVLYAQELIGAYPEAKVILNVRDVDGWYKSYDNTFGAWNRGWPRFQTWFRSWFCAELYWAEQSHDYVTLRFWNHPSTHAATAKWRYREHAAMIRGSVVEPGRLLEWGVQDGWGPLCEFLGKEVPDEPFPSGNTPGDFEKRRKQLLGGYQRRADRNALLTVATLSVLVFGGLRAIRRFEMPQF